MTPLAAFLSRGWIKFPHDPDTARWAEAARSVAEARTADPALRARWLRHGGTWFAGVNVLGNGPDGSVLGTAVAGAAVDFIRAALGFEGFAWDSAQVSVCYPGYPRRDPDESEANHRFRRYRDAAHVDGLRRAVPGRRRHLGECHGFILGIPLDETPPGAAPMVVYEGSHEVMRDAFRARLAGIAAADWAGEDVTEAYVAARRLAFDTCPRRPIPAGPGESYLVHRLALHGVAPWMAPEGPPRTVTYFRPDSFAGWSPERWLGDP